MSDLTLVDVRSFDDDTFSRLTTFAQNALALHADTIMQELSAFNDRRDANAVDWMHLVIVKSILSPGAKLPANIALAKLLVAALQRGETLTSYDDAETYRAACKYGGRSVGKNIIGALLSWPHIAHMSVDDMNVDTLYRMRGARQVALSHKTIRWALALFDATNRVFTLDVHMCRGIARIAGVDKNVDGVTDNAYAVLESYMLRVADACGYGHMPLVVQWAMWNEIRHAGKHAPHIALAQ